jgi:hypothetical protein
MDRVIEYFNSFTEEVNIVKIIDEFKLFSLSFNLHQSSRVFKVEDINFFLQFINERDSAKLNVSIDDGEPFTCPIKFYNQLPDEISSVNELLIDDDEAIITIKLEILKNQKKSTLSIYNLEAFENYFTELHLIHLLNTLNEYLDVGTQNVLEIQNHDVELVIFKSEFLVITTNDNPTSVEPTYNNNLRHKIIKDRLTNTSPQSFSAYNFLPSDFHNEHKSERLISKTLEKLKIIFSVSFIANSTELHENNRIVLNLLGHKFLKIDWDYIQSEIKGVIAFYDIYRWVYLDGDTHDKLELSRNIIGRYLRTLNNTWYLSFDCISAIQSAHAIYLKENVEKYIETKNKVAEIVTEMSVKSKEINQFFISSFKNNNLTLLTFFISLFIFNSLSDNPDSKIFNIEKYYLTLSFLLISNIYLIVTLRQFKNELKANEDYFFSMKGIYDDIFEPRELNKLFSHTHLDDSKKILISTLNRYSTLWILEIVVLLIISIILTFFVKV